MSPQNSFIYAPLSSVIGMMLLLLSAPRAWALTLPLPDDHTDLVGEILEIKIKPGDNLYSIARRHNVGYQELMHANAHIHNPNQLKPNTRLIIPSAFILPEAPRTGIVINLPEMRLYYYPPHAGTVMTYPIAVGRENWRTPIGQTHIIDKTANPAWHVPKSIKAHMLTKGVVLPDVVQPGPDNPLGYYALRLGLPGYLIHGTNNPESVGNRSSSGCIRMYPEDIEELFQVITIGTPVLIINQPVKAALHQNTLYLESHRPFPDQMPLMALELPEILAQEAAIWLNYIQLDQAEAIKNQQSGMPEAIPAF